MTSKLLLRFKHLRFGNDMIKAFLISLNWLLDRSRKVRVAQTPSGMILALGSDVNDVKFNRIRRKGC